MAQQTSEPGNHTPPASALLRRLTSTELFRGLRAARQPPLHLRGVPALAGGGALRTHRRRCLASGPISPSSASHDQTVKLAAYERAGVREYWLVHPVDRVLTIDRHDGQAFGRPAICELKGETSLGVLPEVVVRWDPIAALLHEPREE